MWNRLDWQNFDGRVFFETVVPDFDLMTFTEMTAFMNEVRDAFPGYTDYRLYLSDCLGEDVWYVEGLKTKD